MNRLVKDIYLYELGNSFLKFNIKTRNIPIWSKSHNLVSKLGKFYPKCLLKELLSGN